MRKHLEGLKLGLKQMIGLIPVILAAFILAGMLEAVIPKEFIRQWLAKEAGFKGIFLGTFVCISRFCKTAGNKCKQQTRRIFV